MWEIWQEFCHSLPSDPYLSTTTDPIPILQLFAHRYRNGNVAPCNHEVCSRMVEDTLHAMGRRSPHWAILTRTCNHQAN
jgi:hypothetical protein